MSAPQQVINCIHVLCWHAVAGFGVAIVVGAVLSWYVMATYCDGVNG